MRQLGVEVFDETLLFARDGPDYSLTNAKGLRSEANMTFRFGDHVLDAARRELRRGSQHIAVEPQVFDLLVHLLQNHHRVVSKEELIDSVWAGRSISDSTFTSQINAARRAIGDSGANQTLIRTLPRKGIRFVGSVDVLSDGAGLDESGASRVSTGRRTYPALPDKPSIVVLPFENLSAEKGTDYLADGIVEAITSALSRVRSFFVIARMSAYTYRGRSVNVRDIGKELGVAYVLEGSVQKARAQLRITVQLIETEKGTHVWSSRYDGAIGDLFDLQDRISAQVMGALGPSLRTAEIERSRRKRPQDLGSYDYTMRAMPHVWAREKDENSKALGLLETAISADPDYALALSLAGWCHAQCLVYNWVENIVESRDKALSFAERAAELSGDDPMVLAILGAIHSLVQNHGTARVLLERALAIDPNDAWAWGRLGWLENYVGQPQNAITNFERALRLSPLDPTNFNNYVGMGSANEIMQNYDQAAALFQRALEERPNATWIYRHLASSLYGAGRFEEARRAFAQLTEIFPDLTITKFKQAMRFQQAAIDRMAENLQRLGLRD
ncbi:tetratricopeptide repeat protein [Bradyrhizobium sp. Pear77]|uniref:winged helix-turn-helix domain-containing tetratricopeptide repeat protein n=1 Tax=Bradyrhizobium altum TaxID=1571202 RepID=UPI00289AF71D|nr:winged helix-turn-helix domain-containing tetratricopeptide repeat protein [Bradyrhizobium altum]MCC8960209.1 tetratricopeptide repeat protein [Bradyrhizobium altum]